MSDGENEMLTAREWCAWVAGARDAGGAVAVAYYGPSADAELERVSSKRYQERDYLACDLVEDCRAARRLGATWWTGAALARFLERLAEVFPPAPGPAPGPAAGDPAGDDGPGSPDPSDGGDAGLRAASARCAALSDEVERLRDLAATRERELVELRALNEAQVPHERSSHACAT